MVSTRHWFALIAKGALALLVLNEVRGAVLAAPILWSMYQAGGTWMALWLGFCSLAGIALSVVVPIYGIRVARRRWAF